MAIILQLPVCERDGWESKLGRWVEGLRAGLLIVVEGFYPINCGLLSMLTRPSTHQLACS